MEQPEDRCAPAALLLPDLYGGVAVPAAGSAVGGAAAELCLHPGGRGGAVLHGEAADRAVLARVDHAKRLGVGGKKSPRQDIEEFVRSEEVPEFDPIREYLENLPEWDGKNHVAELFGRIPGLTSEQLGWCATWLRSAVAHWLQMDMFHGNETTPVLIGKQGCGKSTFAYRLLPDHLRQYFLAWQNFITALRISAFLVMRAPTRIPHSL